MRISKETLLKLANDMVDQRVRRDRDILAGYLQGSVLFEPLLGGTADIDLFLIHADEPGQKREIIRLTDDVHLDIAHHSRRQYRQTRELRLDAWMGHMINGGKILYDPQHFLDFTQASVRGQFDRPETVLRRAKPCVDLARQIWMDFQMEREPGPTEIHKYLSGLEHAANAVALLSGAPLTERRFLLNFPSRAAAVGHAGLAAGLMGLLGGPQVDTAVLRSWLPVWQKEFLAPDSPPVRIHPARQHYYQRAFVAMLDGENPQAALWPMLRTWTLAAGCFSAEAPQRQGWQAAVERLGLSGMAFSQRIEALDAYLDTIDEALEAWGREHGA